MKGDHASPQGRGALILASPCPWLLLSLLPSAAVILLCDRLLPDHSHERLLNPDCASSLLSSVCRWDSLHFQHVSQHGYSVIKNVAFLPLSPLISLPLPFAGKILLSILLKALAAQLLALLLYEAVSANKARSTLMFFVFSPSSVFYCTNYSQSLFSLLLFGFLLCHLQARQLPSLIFFTLMGFTRSNYLFFTPVLGLLLLHRLWVQFWLSQFTRELFTFLRGAATLAVCVGVECQSWLWNGYSHVQNKFWEVGIFQYWQLPTLHLFLWAAPAFLMTIRGLQLGDQHLPHTHI